LVLKEKEGQMEMQARMGCKDIKDIKETEVIKGIKDIKDLKVREELIFLSFVAIVVLDFLYIQYALIIVLVEDLMNANVMIVYVALVKVIIVQKHVNIKTSKNAFLNILIIHILNEKLIIYILFFLKNKRIFVYFDLNK
jgi:hypothetical protein